MYATAKGVPQNHVKAHKWLTLAAEQGHAEAQNKLGKMYMKAQGVTKDSVKALKWFKLAAKQGHAYARRQMRMYQDLTVKLTEIKRKLKKAEAAVLQKGVAGLKSEEEENDPQPTAKKAREV